MGDWIDGLDAARRAGWAKAYRMNQLHAEATAVALCVCSLARNPDISSTWLRQVALAAEDYLAQPARVDVDENEWNRHFFASIKTFQTSNQPAPGLGWPVTEETCV